MVLSEEIMDLLRGAFQLETTSNAGVRGLASAEFQKIKQGNLVTHGNKTSAYLLTKI